MLKNITLVLFTAMLFLPLDASAQDAIVGREVSDNDTVNYSYDIDENSFNVSDEQFKEVQEVEQENEKQDFNSKVINSSHFSSGTATRTWIPFRRFHY